MKLYFQAVTLIASSCATIVTLTVGRVHGHEYGYGDQRLPSKIRGGRRSHLHRVLKQKGVTSLSQSNHDKDDDTATTNNSKNRGKHGRKLKKSTTSYPTMSIEPTLTPAPTFSPTDELSACTDINVAQYVMCGVDHIAICYQHGDH